MAVPEVRKEGAEDPGGECWGAQVRHSDHKYPPTEDCPFRNLLLRGKGSVTLPTASTMGQTPLDMMSLLEAQEVFEFMLPLPPPECSSVLERNSHD